MANTIYNDEFFDAYAEILIECWSDEEFKKRFMQDPVGVFKEWEVELAEDIVFKVIETTEPGAVVVSLPPKPEGLDQLSEEDLEAVAGGIFNFTQPLPGGGKLEIGPGHLPKIPCK